MKSSNSAFGGQGLEQIDPFDTSDSNLWRKAEYLGRYLFAADFLRRYRPGTVADISCGVGYGTNELCKAARNVIGVDCSQELIEIASMRCKNTGVRFLKKDLNCEDLTPDVADRSVDAVVSFETLEHLTDSHRAVSQFAQVLQPGGFFICSVPNALYESGDDAGLPKNKSHKQWFSFGSLSRIVQSHDMQVLYRLGQSWSRAIFRREQQLSHARCLTRKLSEEPIMHTPEMIRWLSYVAAYPTVEDVDGSYSIIVVAQKK